jgi:RNase P subunit RPR2
MEKLIKQILEPGKRRVTCIGCGRWTNVTVRYELNGKQVPVKCNKCGNQMK